MRFKLLLLGVALTVSVLSLGVVLFIGVGDLPIIDSYRTSIYDEIEPENE